MLSKNARKVLKIAKKTTKKAISYADLVKKLGLDFGAVRSAGNQLIENELATEKYHAPTPGKEVLWGISLTEKGRNSRKYFWVGIIKFLFNSIVVPIAVSIITTILTTRFLAGL